MVLGLITLLLGADQIFTGFDYSHMLRVVLRLVVRTTLYSFVSTTVLLLSTLVLPVTFITTIDVTTITLFLNGDVVILWGYIGDTLLLLMLLL